MLELLSIPSNLSQILIPVIIFLFIVWLIHRIENRLRPMAKQAIYDNLPFLKTSAESFEQKINFLAAHLESLENRITQLEKKLGNKLGDAP